MYLKKGFINYRKTKQKHIFIAWLHFFNIKHNMIRKLDWVGPFDNRPSINKLHNFVKKKCDMWHMTCDTRHMICDTWHVTDDTWNVTHDMWHVVGGEHSLKQLPSSLILQYCNTVWDLWYLEDCEEKADWLTKWINEW